MKKTVLYLLVFLLIGCGAKTTKTNNLSHDFVKDQYGVVRRVDPQEKNVYLVFTAHYSVNDEGYFENFDGIVPVLDILKEKNVKGSFFPTGECFRQAKYQAPIQRIIDEGHYLSAHSDKHLLYCDEGSNRDSNFVTADSIKADIVNMEAELTKFGLTKDQFCWMIPPYETYNDFSANILRELGYKLINPTEGLLNGSDWAPEGSKSFYSGEQILERLWTYEQENNLNGAVLLVHAMVYPNRQETDRLYVHLGEIIDKLRDLGYGFKTCHDILDADPDVEPSKEK